MSRETPSFSDVVLDASERFQFATHHTRLGRQIVKYFAGSDLREYRQILWLPPRERIQAYEGGTITVPGADTKKFAKHWPDVAVLSAKRAPLEALVGEGSDRVQAIAYRSAKELHVGIALNGSDFIHPLDDEHNGVAPRIGSGEAQFQIGAYEERNKRFIALQAGEVALQHVIAGNELSERRLPIFAV